MDAKGKRSQRVKKAAVDACGKGLRSALANTSSTDLVKVIQRIAQLSDL
jgi:hypothetical protein